MRALLLLLVIPFLCMAKERRIEVRLPANSVGHEKITITYDDEKNSHAQLKIKGKTKDYDVSSFYCMKKSDHFLCVGDDDAGNFKIFKDAVEIDYIHINENGENFIEYKGPKGRLHYR